MVVLSGQGPEISLFSTGRGGYFGGSGGVKRSGREADHPLIVPKLRMCGAISPPPHMPSRRGAQLRTGPTVPTLYRHIKRTSYSTSIREGLETG